MVVVLALLNIKLPSNVSCKFAIIGCKTPRFSEVAFAPHFYLQLGQLSSEFSRVVLCWVGCFFVTQILATLAFAPAQQALSFCQLVPELPAGICAAARALSCRFEGDCQAFDCKLQTWFYANFPVLNATPHSTICKRAKFCSVTT